MKKWVVITLTITAFFTMAPSVKSQAQDPVTEAIKAGIRRVIRAIDLQIQRLQNKTIWLQNAQKEIENALSKLKLDEISEWVEKQRQQYAVYYEELWKVKNAVTYYRSIRDIIDKQINLVEEYKRAYALFKKDKHFSAEEIRLMGEVYTAILDESVKNLDEIMLVVNSFSTQMSDAKRLEIINTAASKIDENIVDLRRFNNNNVMLSLQRTKDEAEINFIKELYGL